MLRKLVTCLCFSSACLASMPSKWAHERGKPWRRHTIDDSSRGADGVRLADVNGDGLMDIATGWEEGGIVRVYLHPGHAKSKGKWPAVTVGKVGSPEDAVFADVDGDGAVDVVSCCEGRTRAVFVHWAPKEKARYLDRAAWRTEAFHVLKGKQMWMFALPMQVDGQHGIDLVIGAKGRGAQIGWLRSPAKPRDLAAWTWHPLRPVGWVMSLAAADFDGDGDLDVAATDRKGARRGLFWLENPGPGPAQLKPWKEHFAGVSDREMMFLWVRKWPAVVGFTVAARPHEILSFTYDKRDSNPWMLLPNGMPPGTGTAKGVAVGDINLDGRPDYVITCEHAKGKVGVFWATYRRETGWRAHDISGLEGTKYDLVELIDLDGDGDLDVLTCEERENLGVIWYENPTRVPPTGE